MQKETIFKRKVLKDLNRLPSLWLVKTQQRAQKGTPDILACFQGRFIGIELKIDGERPTPLQEMNLKRIQQAGGVAFYTMPLCWESHYAMLTAMVTDPVKE